MPRQDPRLEDFPGSANDAIRDRAIRHLLFLVRLSNGEAREVLRFIDDELLPDVTSKLNQRLLRIERRGFDLGPVTTRRLQELAAEIEETIQFDFDVYQKSMVERAAELAVDEASFAIGSIQASVPVQLALISPDPRKVRQMVLERPLSGEKLGAWFKGISGDAATRVNRQLRLGIAQGETSEQIIRRIRGTARSGFTDGVLQQTRREAEALVRSAIIHVSTQARQMAFAENEGIVKEVIWVSSLDSRTCPICGPLDLKRFPLNEGPRPPVHPNCRCTVTPRLKSLREIGIDADDPKVTRASNAVSKDLARKLKRMPTAQRRAIKGKLQGQIPGDITFEQWLKGQPLELQEDVLGKTRARLFRRGDLKLSAFTNNRNQIMSLKALRRREADAFEKAGL